VTTIVTKKRPPTNYIAEWFGHRVHPVATGDPAARADQSAGRCPFLTNMMDRETACVKGGASAGVCTISAVSNGPRQDWLACPIRALDEPMLDDAAKRVFDFPADAPVQMIAAPSLVLPDKIMELKNSVATGLPTVVYFQNKLGGEISIRATDRSPELSFDATFVEMVDDGGQLTIGRYGIFEIQTMDFHGGYQQATDNLRNAAHLHRDTFADAVNANPQWAGEKVEGPNIANTFKRTFYQMMFKFQIGSHGQGAGAVLAIPEAVWDSWQRFLGKPDLVEQSDGTFHLRTDDGTEPTRAWIYVFDLDDESGITPNPLRMKKVIHTTAESLAHYALQVSPAAALEEGGPVDQLIDTLRMRLGRYLPELLTVPR
jgi:hypothetical protein